MNFHHLALFCILTLRNIFKLETIASAEQDCYNQNVCSDRVYKSREYNIPGECAMPKGTLYSMLQESLTAESPMHKFRRALDDEERRALDAMLHTSSGFKPYVESTGELSSLETLLLFTALRQSQKIERLELLLQRLTVRVLELYASQEPMPQVGQFTAQEQIPEPNA